MVAAGYKDITLLGQNVNSYGKDLGLAVDFSRLLGARAALEELCYVSGGAVGADTVGLEPGDLVFSANGLLYGEDPYFLARAGPTRVPSRAGAAADSTSSTTPRRMASATQRSCSTRLPREARASISA